MTQLRLAFALLLVTGCTGSSAQRPGSSDVATGGTGGAATGSPPGGATTFCPFAGGQMWPGFAAAAVAAVLQRL
jgi:hypothetical protein